MLPNGPILAASRRLWSLPADVPELPGRDQAQREAARELSRAGYEVGPGFFAALREWLSTFVSDWLHRMLGNTMRGLVSPTGIKVAVAVVAVVLLAVVLWSVRTSRRGPRKARSGRPLVLEGEQVRLTGSQYRDLARAAAGNGDWNLAITEHFRAIATALDEAQVLPDRPSHTVAEIIGDAGTALPTCAVALAEAGRQFNDVRYGGLSGTSSGYRVLQDADVQVQEALASAQVPAAAGTATTGSDLGSAL